jgi:hypothetical protein
MYEFIIFAVIMYEFIHFLQKLRARASRKHTTASAQREPQGRSPSSPPAPTRPRPIFVDPIIVIYNQI